MNNSHFFDIEGVCQLHRGAGLTPAAAYKWRGMCTYTDTYTRIHILFLLFIYPDLSTCAISYARGERVEGVGFHWGCRGSYQSYVGRTTLRFNGLKIQTHIPRLPDRLAPILFSSRGISVIEESRWFSGWDCIHPMDIYVMCSFFAVGSKNYFSWKYLKKCF